jgi:hypothetical protein
LTTIQDAIDRRIPGDALFRCPAASLHLSVFQLVWARSEEARGEGRAWAACCGQVLADLGAVAASAQEFLLRSPSIHIEKSAVIIKFARTHALERIRDQISAVARQAELSWNRPKIQHVSLFRYSRSIVLDQVIDACGRLQSPDLTWRVCGLRLVRENVYPSLDVTVIEDYEFA